LEHEDPPAALSIEDALATATQEWATFSATLESEPDPSKIDTMEIERKLTMCLMVLSAVSKAQVSQTIADDLIKLVMTVLVNEKLVVTQPALFSLNGCALAIFTRVDSLVGVSQEVFEGALLRTITMIQSLSTVSLGVPPHEHAEGEECDSEEEAEPTDEQAQMLDTWTACSDILLTTANLERRSASVKLGNQIVDALVKLLLSVTDISVFVPVAEVLSQILLLSFTPNQVKGWEDIDPHDIEDLLEGEEGVEPNPGKMIGEVETNPNYYVGYPFFQAEIDNETLAKIFENMLEMVQAAAVNGSPLASAFAVLCIQANKLKQEESQALLKKNLDSITEQLKETNTFPTLLPKIPLFNVLGHVFAFATIEDLKPFWQDLFNMLENVRTTEQNKLKPKPQARRGRGGRGGRGRGGGGGGHQEVDPEKALEFRLLQKCLAFCVGQLVYKGEDLLLTNAQKFFQLTEPAFKSRELMFDYLIALKAYLARTPTADTHPAYGQAKGLLDNKMPNNFKADHDNLYDQYSSAESKGNSVLRLTQVATARTSIFDGSSIFPEYLEKVVNALIHTVSKNALRIGPNPIVCLEKVVVANKDDPFLQSKIKEILDSLLPYLAAQVTEETV